MSIRLGKLDWQPRMDRVSPFSEREAGWENVAPPANGITNVVRLTKARNHLTVIETAPATSAPKRARGKPLKRKTGTTEAAQLVARLLREQRQSVRWIAKRMQVAETTVCRWLDGSVQPQPDKLERLREVAL